MDRRALARREKVLEVDYYSILISVSKVATVLQDQIKYK
jgi:hypothetical protein